MSIAEKLGNKIFAIETNVQTIRLRVQRSNLQDILPILEDIQKSLEYLKEIKQWLDIDTEPTPETPMSDAEIAWMEDKADGFLDSEEAHP